MKRIAQLDNPIRDYAWGSHTFIAALQGRAVPSSDPQAELWLGAHPVAPSRLRVDSERVSLADVIAADPVAVLGAGVARKFGGELPFLLKVLAADEPLSLQAHPNAEQARRGFDREERAGVPLTAPERCYRDAHHKPELLCALTPFEAVVGFRRIEASLALLGQLGSPALEPSLADFRADPGRDGLARFFEAMLRFDVAQRPQLIAEIRQGAANRAAEDPAFEWVGSLHARHPDDVGILAPLLLNFVRLEPGQALYLPAGELHAYLRGVGIEIMASSDNVLRGGLTPKHVDVPELLHVLSFSDGDAPIVTPTRGVSGEEVYVTPAAEFELSRIRVRPGAAFSASAERSVEILLCIEGACCVEEEGGGEIALSRGGSLLVPACTPGYRASCETGEAILYRAAVPSAGARR